MPYIKVGEENSAAIELYYEDHGQGKPIVLIHGWPLSGRSWEKQTIALTQAGFRVITYDRRGFGESSKPWIGYDYDTLAHDLNALITTLDLEDAAIFGFSMGGGEVARYVATFGTERVNRAGFIAAIPPALLKSPQNPQGFDKSVFDGMRAGIAGDRPAFLWSFLENNYNVDVLKPARITDEVVRLNWMIAAGASPRGTYDLVAAWGTDFREDLKHFDIPTLVVHGDADRILPIAVTGKRTHDAIKNSRYVVIKDGPHGIIWTHADELNRAMLDFLA